MKVKDKEFDVALHDPVYMVKKLKNMEDKIKTIHKTASKLMEMGNEFLKDLILHRQNLQDSIEFEETTKKLKEGGY